MNSDVQSFVGLLSFALLIILVMFAGLVAIPVGIGGGIFYFWFYKSKQKQREEEERAAVKALRRKVEAADYLTETDFRNAVYDKLGQDIYLDEAIGEMYEWEALSEPPKFPEVSTPIEIGRYKDQAAYFLNNADNTDLVPAVVQACRPLVGKSEDGMFEAFRQLKLSDVQYLAQQFHHAKYFKKLYERLSYNQQNAKGKDVDEYIRDTPFEHIKERPTKVPLYLPFEHTMIIGTTGSGKTQLIQYMISERLKEDCCVIVIDNQRQMIPKLAKLGYDMQYISPHYPLAMNIFDMPRDENTAPLLRYVLAAMINAPLTTRQNNVFQFAVNAVLHLKGNIDTFHSILEGEKFDLEGLDKTTRRFFEKEFYKPGKASYVSTREEISWRIWALLTNPVMRDMFNAKENKVQLEIDRDLILIDADINKLQDYTGMFGRFFLAQLLQLAHHRFTGSHRPIYLFIDECYFYLDSSAEQMMETARKAEIGMTMALHRMARIKDPSVADALLGLTNTKFASNINVTDQNVISRAMRCDPDYIQNQKPLHFALWQRGHDSVSVEVPAGVIEDMDQHPIPNKEMIRRYGRHGEGEGPTDDDTKEELDKRRIRAFKKIPEHLKSLYSSDEAMNFSKEIKSTYDLDGDQYNRYLDISGDLALGFFPASELKQKLQDALGLEPDVAQSMTDDIVWNFDDLIQYHGLTSKGDNGGSDDNPMMGEEDGEQ